MAYSDDDLNRIFDRTSGKCHICGKKLAWKNYGRPVARAAWEVEHSKPQANGGTSRLNNLYASCIPCNRSKGTRATRTARAWNGRTRAPLSHSRRREEVQHNTLVGGLLGAAAGVFIAGRRGAVAGGMLGSHIGSKVTPDS